jgi:hypothetical protein
VKYSTTTVEGGYGPWSISLVCIGLYNIDNFQVSFIPEIIAKCVVSHDISPDCLGHRNFKKTRSCKTTDDEDRPEEIVEEPCVDQLLQGKVALCLVG